MSASEYYGTGKIERGYYPPQQSQSSYQQQQPQYAQQQPPSQPYAGMSAGPNREAVGERGLGSTLVGAGTGGYIGHKLGKGAMGTLLGGAIGAVATNVISHKSKGHHEKDEHHGCHGHHHLHHASPSPHGGLGGHGRHGG